MNLRSAEPGVLKLSMTVDEDKLIEGALKVLAAIRPTWIEENIKFKVFTDGITNKLLGCFYADAPDDVILVRVYGQKTDLLIDRNAETRNIQLLHAFGYAPNLYATFTNGLAYEYVPGEILMEDTCLDPQVFPLVAVMMANMHRVDCGPDVPKEPCMWTKTCQFMNIMPDKFSDVEKHARFVKLIPNRQKLQQEYELLKSELMDLGSPVVFSHNDLLLGNIIYNSKKECVTFIDYEYASYNYQAFDIGNHFAEFAGVSEVDYSRYPSPEFQRQWLRIYLEAYLNPVEASEKNESLEVFCHPT
ncbi:ethanolamine kinase isoform X2 [Anabrus simplex]|uniref:ethanolamine kinase isoform X2 n=1 Tax=Anabrus simplex TaxID=316456 RepID=UPI0034DD1B2D